MKSSKKATVSLTLMVIMLPVIGSAQEQERVIDQISWRTEPVKVLKLKTKNKEVELGKKFSEEDDWLRGFAVTVENTANKAIARIELRLSFPWPGNGSSQEKPVLVEDMIYGKEPDVLAAEVPQLVLPGDSVEIKLLEVNLPFIKTALKNLGYPDKIKHAEIMLRSVTFVDGSEWRGDEILYPDPNDPKEKINPRRPIYKKAPGVSRLLPGQPIKSQEFRFLNAGLQHAHSPASHSSLSLRQVKKETASSL